MKYQRIIEMSAKQAFKLFPEAFNNLPVNIKNEILSDNNYICRYDVFTGLIEFGFSSDSWHLRLSK